MKTEEIIAREKNSYRPTGAFLLQCDHLKGEDAFITFDLAGRVIAVCRDCAEEWYFELLGRIAD